ncbi:MAG: hypothetical protein DRJ03_01690 [Chloroflexi bacterium]|nr:MAG: hypothetical protein DRJ03_01690 [Chloroflexota bacterium]
MMNKTLGIHWLKKSLNFWMSFADMSEGGKRQHKQMLREVEALEAELARLRPLAEATELLPADLARDIMDELRDYKYPEDDQYQGSFWGALNAYAEALEATENKK